MKNRLRPMGIGAVLDNSFMILREKFWTFQGVNFFALLPAFSILIVEVVLAIVIFLPYASQISTNFFDVLEGVVAKSGPSLVLLGLLFIALMIAMIIGSIYMVYGNIKLFKCGLHQETCTVKQAFEGIKGKRWRYFGSQFMVFIYSLPFLAVGIFVMFYFLQKPDLVSIIISNTIGRIIYYLSYIVYFLFVLSPVVVFLENKRIFKSLSRSFSLLKNHRWRIFGTLFVMYTLAYVLMFIIVVVVAIPVLLLVWFRNVVTISLACIFGLGGLFIFSICMSVFYGPVTAIYYDLLIRKEGYDIQLQLANDLTTTSDENDRGLTV